MKRATMSNKRNRKWDVTDAPSNCASAKGSRDKGVQYLLLSVAGYLCATFVFGFLFNNTKKKD